MILLIVMPSETSEIGKMKRHLIYAPQPNATPDEVLQVLKVFTVGTLPEPMRTEQMMLGVYESLPENAKRHFKIKEE
jgi:hypothetical protein